MIRILVVEDHDNLRDSLSKCLGSEGYHIDLAPDLKSARELVKLRPRIVILDWMLPDGQGIDLLSEMRRSGDRTPTIFLSARTELVDKVLGLEMGANDFLTKPFEFRELVARIRVQLRDDMLPENQSASMLTVASLFIDRIKHKVQFKGNFIDLVKKEYDLLVLLAENPEKVFSRDELLNKVWGYDVFPTTRTVDTHVMLLRQKIHSDLIETVRSVGYRLKPL